MWKKHDQPRKKIRRNLGYTLPEVLAAVSIVGVLAVISGPSKSWFENPLADGTNQTVGLFKVIRMRAISSTSAYRIQPDPQAPNSKFKVQIASTRGCETTTKLTASAAPTDTDLKVASTSGLVVGDKIKVGNDENNNEILATDSSTITLGQALGSSQAANISIELINNWLNDKNFVEEDVTLPKKIEMSSTSPNWTLCFDSRGIANLYDSYGVVNDNLSLTLTHTLNKTKSKIQILQGGAIQVQ